MKRLLAAGCGSIYQISKVFRQGESGQRHNPEFTLLEWYREGWDHHQLMGEISQLLMLLLSPYREMGAPYFVTYESVFQNVLGLNPHYANKDELIACVHSLGLGDVLAKEEPIDRFLELLFSHSIEPLLGISSAETAPDNRAKK